MPDKIAIAFSDLHLSLQAPACRADKDWLAVQAHYLKQVKDTADGLPILFAGDLFDRWNPPPELIHFALEHLPDDMICIPGQHDLPNHRMEEMHRSGYGVLKKAKKIRDVSGDATGNMGGYIVRGFGWNEEITTPLLSVHLLRIALIHRYFWTGDKKYPDAPEECNVAACSKVLKTYNLAITGDNHLDFIAKAGDCTIVNCGGAIRRKSDEISREPMMAVIFSDGSVKRKKFDTSIDRFHDNPKEREETALDLKSFIEGLESLGEQGLNFKEAVENALRSEDIDKETKTIIMTALETKE